MKLEGVSGLVMHNGRLADSLDPITRELRALTDKADKTEADEQEIGDIEWRGSLYWDPDLGAVIPTANLRRMLRDAGGAWKLGTKVLKAVVPLAAVVQLQHDGPKTVAALAAKPEYRWRTTVKLNGRTRIARTRPIFRRWSLTADFELDETELALADFHRIVERAGRLFGLGDANKIGYGRFTATVAAA
jgi:hypothetical protein